MFNRSEETYKMNTESVKFVLQDEVNPLRQIGKIVNDCSTILDIGAGNGLLALVLKQLHPKIIIDGIEPNAYAASIARQYYRNFYTGYAQEFLDFIKRDNYDFIVLADVLEHMPDPLSFLTALREIIGEKTQIIISLPNVAFASVRIALLCGSFAYVDSGLLEHTHLRFFTDHTIQEMIKRAGLFITKMFYLQRNYFATEINIKQLPISQSVFRLLQKDKLAHVYQFLLVVSKKTLPTFASEFLGSPVKHPWLEYSGISCLVKNYLRKFKGCIKRRRL